MITCNTDNFPRKECETNKGNKKATVKTEKKKKKASLTLMNYALQDIYIKLYIQPIYLHADERIF